MIFVLFILLEYFCLVHMLLSSVDTYDQFWYIYKFENF